MTELRRTYEKRTVRPKTAREPEGKRPPEWDRAPAGGRGGRAGGQKKRPRTGLLLVLVLLAAAALGAFFLYRRFGPGTAWADYAEIYGAGAGSTVVFGNGIRTEGEAVTRNGRTYLPESLAAGADSKWYHSDEGLLLYSLANETVAISPSSHT